MNATRIVWQWCSLEVSVPYHEHQAHVQTLAMGVILAHQGGNMASLDDNRTEEKTKEVTFDPAGESADNEDVAHKTVKERIFDRLFEDMMVHVEIFHCWNSFNYTDDSGKNTEQDNGAHYLVCVGELLSGPPLMIGDEEM